MLNNLEDYIYKALNVNDNNVRRQAEALLFQLANDNPTDLFASLAQIISNNSKNLITRQSSCTVFSRLATFRLPHGVYWDNVHQSTKQTIKDLLLSTLISHEVLIIRAGANTIAHIASIEIPRGEWLEILDSLAENTQHEEYSIRLASVTTLGFICQELKNVKSNINSQSCKQILGSLLMSLEKEGDIVESALAALRDSIQFLKHIFTEKIEFCNKMFEYLLPILNHHHFRHKVYEILFEFCKFCYPLLGGYIQVIVDFTVGHIQLRNEDSILSLILWETIGTEYLERRDQSKDRLNENQYVVPNFVLMAQKQILREVMGCILIVKKSDEEFADLREAAVQTLSVMVECGNREMVDIVTEGVSKVISSSNAGQRQASALLFSCLASYEDREDIVTRFAAGFNYLYKLMHDSELIVVKNSLNGFVTLSENYPEVFLTNLQIRQIFLHLLAISSQPDEVISMLALNILANVTQALPRYPEPIATDPQLIITEVVRLFEAGLEQVGKEASTSQKLIVILMNIIMSTNQMTIISQLITHLIPKYHHYASINIRDQSIVLDHIVSVIHTCLLAFSKSALPKTEHKEQIYQLIDKHISLYGVESEGINLISVAATCYKKDFRVRIDYYWGKIMKGLEHIDQKPIFKAALSCVSDIARNQESEIADKLNLVFEKLVRYMHQNIDRQLKTDILKCFGDLSLGLKRYSDNIINPLLEIVQNCFVAVEMFSQSETEKGYAQELKQSLIEMYHCLAFAVNSQQRVNQQMAAHFQSISQFIVKSCDVKYKPTVDYLRSCLYLIFDSALFYSKHASYVKQTLNVLQSNQVARLIETIKRYRERTDIKDLLDFIESRGKPRR